MNDLSVRRWNWLSVLLLVFMLQVATARLVITHWTEFLFFAQTLAMLGLLLGLTLGHSHFKKRAVRLLTLGYSIIIIPWQLTLAIEDELLSARLASVGGRLYFSLIQFFQREPVQDSLLFVAFISIVVWFLSIASGYWWARHRNYLVAVLPGAIFTLVIHLYDPTSHSRIWFLAAYLLFAMMLLGHQYYLKNRESWRERRIFVMQESAFDVTRGMVIAASLFVVIAWTAPASRTGMDAAMRAWRRITEPWREAQEWFSNAVDSLEGSSVTRPTDFYGNQLSLGGGTPLSDNVLFSVEAPEVEDAPRYYWRGYVYDFYQNNSWYAAAGVSEDFSPSTSELRIPDESERVTANFTFKIETQQSLLYTATQPIWVSRPGRIQAVTTESGEQDLLAWAAVPSLLAGEQYQVTASLHNPSIQRLQNVQAVYPKWVTDRYLQLPDDFSPRIAELAHQITLGMDTPYEKATAITRFLRQEIEYVNPLPEPPPARVDPLEWVLFDLKQGFCNYYAAAEVLMLRSVGVPARMAVGFSEGAFDSEANVYIVRSLNAHAWPEVYFPGIGWVEFEPTGNQDPLLRPNRPEDAPPPGTNGNAGNLSDPSRLESDVNIPGIRPSLEEGTGQDNSGSATAGQSILRAILYGILAILLIASLWLLNQQYSVFENIPFRLQAAYERNGGRTPPWLAYWVRWTTLTPIERSFETINRSLRLLGVHPAPYATPTERAKSLSKKLPIAAASIEAMLEQHQASLFTPKPGNPSTARRASLNIWYFTLQSIFQRFFYGRPIE